MVAVVLLTTRAVRQAGTEDVVDCADEFLTEPLDLGETLSRVRHAVRAGRIQSHLRAENRRLRVVEAQHEDLTSMVVHDMRGPLMCASGYLDLIGRGDTRLLPDREMLARAEGCLHALSELVTSLLDVSRLEAGKLPLHLADAPVAQLAQQALQSLVGPQRETGRVRLIGSDGSAVARCDATLVRRVIANLIANALKYSPTDSSVEVRVESAGKAVRVSVQDQGPGVARQDQGRIFEKFTQLDPKRGQRPGGVGLGLAFCRLAVEAHGGRMELESEEGRGSRFWFELPVHGPTVSAVVA